MLYNPYHWSYINFIPTLFAFFHVYKCSDGDDDHANERDGWTIGQADVEHYRSTQSYDDERGRVGGPIEGERCD